MMNVGYKIRIFQISHRSMQRAIRPCTRQSWASPLTGLRVSLIASTPTCTHKTLSGTLCILLAMNGNNRLAKVILQLLLERGQAANLASTPTHSGKTALDYALERGHEGIIATLVKPEWKTTVGLPWDAESMWIHRWSYIPWSADLDRVLESSRPAIEKSEHLRRKLWGESLTVYEDKQRTAARWHDSLYIAIQVPDGVPSPVRRIVFNMTSHDQGRLYAHEDISPQSSKTNTTQGWSNKNPVSNRNWGLYIGSRTWFEAEICNQTDDQERMMPRWEIREKHPSFRCYASTQDHLRSELFIAGFEGVVGIHQWR